MGGHLTRFSCAAVLTATRGRFAPVLGQPRQLTYPATFRNRLFVMHTSKSKIPRLKKRAEFLRVAGKGRKAALPGVVVQAMDRGDAAPVRLGFTVTKKVGNAVVRNRTRRRLREAARLLLRESPAAGADLVLVGREGTRGRPFPLLIEDLRRGLIKLGVTMPAGQDAAR